MDHNSASASIEQLSAGDHHYQAYVGPVRNYDLLGAIQFNLLTALGLKKQNTLLDVGCGSLRSGKLFIPYLDTSKYYGVEPNDWLIKEGINNELGKDILELKKPKFYHFEDFKLGQIGLKFDYIIAQSIFSHASLTQIKTCLTEVKQTLHQDGIFAVTFVEGNEDYQGEDWVYPNCVTYTKTTIKSMIAAAGLRGKRSDWLHPSQTWYLVYNKESASARNKINQAQDFFKKDHSIIEYIKGSRFLNNPLTRGVYRILNPRSN